MKNSHHVMRALLIVCCIILGFIKSVDANIAHYLSQSDKQGIINYTKGTSSLTINQEVQKLSNAQKNALAKLVLTTTYGGA